MILYIPIELGVVKLQHLAEVKVMFEYMEWKATTIFSAA